MFKPIHDSSCGSVGKSSLGFPLLFCVALLSMTGAPANAAKCTISATGSPVCLGGGTAKITVTSDCQDGESPPTPTVTATSGSIALESGPTGQGTYTWVFSWTPSQRGNATISAVDACQNTASPTTVSAYLDMGISPSAQTCYLPCSVDATASYQLTGSCHPHGATWTISGGDGNGGLPTIDNNTGTVTYSAYCATGTYTIIATSNDDASYYAMAKLILLVQCDCHYHTMSRDPVFQTSESWPSCPPSNPIPSYWPIVAYTSPNCPDTVTLTCGSCAAITPVMPADANCVNVLHNGTTVGHCLYAGSSWAASIHSCICGEVCMFTHWKVISKGLGSYDPPANYYCVFDWSCTDGNMGPDCYKADGTARTCDANGYHDWLTP